MRQFLLLTASVGAMELAFTVAQAADVIPEAAPAAPDWTAFHIGVGGGAGYNTYNADSTALLFLDAILDQVPDGPPIFGDSIEDDDLDAWYGFGTIEVGFDVQFDGSPFVIGILANYDFNGDSSADAESSSSFETLSLDNRIEAELDDAWFVGGRVGFVFNDDTLIYGLGGYTWVDGQVKADAEETSTGFVSTHVDEEESVDGWTIGAGIEHLITANLSLKVEYRHDFLDEIDFDEAHANNGVILTQEGSVDFSRDTVRAVLSWRFNPFE